MYAAAAARTLHRPCTRVELHHLPTGEVLAWEHTEESLQGHLRRADALAAELGGLDERFRAGMSADEADEAFPARVGAAVRLVRVPRRCAGPAGRCRRTGRGTACDRLSRGYLRPRPWNRACTLVGVYFAAGR